MKAKRSIFSLAFALILALSSLTAYAMPPRDGDSGADLVVESYQARGAVVMVEVVNTKSQPKTAWVRVEAQVAGKSTISMTPVALAGGQSAQVAAGFMGLVEGVIVVGITTEGGDPF